MLLSVVHYFLSSKYRLSAINVEIRRLTINIIFDD